jgi:hypothetical protein
MIHHHGQNPHIDLGVHIPLSGENLAPGVQLIPLISVHTDGRNELHSESWIVNLKPFYLHPTSLNPLSERVRLEPRPPFVIFDLNHHAKKKSFDAKLL